MIENMYSNLLLSLKKWLRFFFLANTDILILKCV